jgi:hypothetical protein
MSKKPQDLRDPHLGMQSMHDVLGTEPASRATLTPEARQYSDALAALSGALILEQAAVFSGQRTTSELTAALIRVRDTRYVFSNMSHRGPGPQSTEETP